MKLDFTKKEGDPIKLAKIAPVLIKKLDANIKEQAIVITAKSFYDQHLIYYKEGKPNIPDWLENCLKKHKDILVVDDVDSLSKDDQQCFYELLKYNQLSSIKLPIKLKIFIVFKDFKNIGETLARLCLVSE